MIATIINSILQKSRKQGSPERTDNLKDQVWSEMYDAKKYEYYLSGYLRRLRNIRKNTQAAILVISAVGLLIDRDKYQNAPFIVLLIVTAAQFLKEVIPVLNIDDKLLEKLPEYRMLYVRKFEALHELFFGLDNDLIDFDQAKNVYFEIRKMNVPIQELDNSLHLPDKKEVLRKALHKANIYMNNLYPSEPNEQTPAPQV